MKRVIFSFLSAGVALWGVAWMAGLTGGPVWHLQGANMVTFGFFAFLSYFLSSWIPKVPAWVSWAVTPACLALALVIGHHYFSALERVWWFAAVFLYLFMPFYAIIGGVAGLIWTWKPWKLRVTREA